MPVLRKKALEKQDASVGQSQEAQTEQVVLTPNLANVAQEPIVGQDSEKTMVTDQPSAPQPEVVEQPAKQTKGRGRKRAAPKETKTQDVGSGATNEGKKQAKGKRKTSAKKTLDSSETLPEIQQSQDLKGDNAVLQSKTAAEIVGGWEKSGGDADYDKGEIPSEIVV